MASQSLKRNESLQVINKTLNHNVERIAVRLPLKPGEECPVREAKPTGQAAVDVVLADGRRLAIAADPDPKGRIQFHETLSNGQPGRRTVWKEATDP